MLRGGLDDWKDLILFPTVPANPNPEQLAAFAKMKELSKYFGGAPRTESAAKAPEAKMQLPKLQLPVSPSSPAIAPKKKKEGC